METKDLISLYERSAVGVFRSSPEGRYTAANPAGVRMHGYESERELLQAVQNIGEEIYVHASDRAALRDQLLQHGTVEAFECEVFRHKTRERIWVAQSVWQVTDDDGRRIYLEGIVEDITERKRVEEDLRQAYSDLERRVEERTNQLEEANRELRRSEARFQAYAASSADWFWEMDADLRFTYMSPSVERLLGVPAEWHYGKTREELLPEDFDPEVWQHHLQTLRERKPFRDFVFRRVGEGVKPLWLRSSGVPVFAEDGTFLGYHGSGSDVTATVEAEEALRQSEARLRQAQKMEAVGQLTGGVAHDFNNLLTVIHGNAELLVEQLGPENIEAQAILRSAGRGAELTQRLLAFARQQPLRPQAIDLAALMAEMSDLLKRVLGETIELEIAVQPNMCTALADPGQLESALLNLAINARDAMRKGGRMKIDCASLQVDFEAVDREADLAPGAYVALSVSDTGRGMSDTEREHAFEPFFTTKDVGEGSGLGLSMVYGFAKQSGGQASIDSELGQGTTVKIYLPKADAAPDPRPEDLAESIPRGQGEKILVLEDDEEVRVLVVKMLERLGYRVISVTAAAAARPFLDQVDLVLSDVVLPGSTSGPELAAEAWAVDPALKFIFMSGYPADGISRSGSLGPDKVLLNKPFEVGVLARALRQALGSGRE